MALTQKRWLTAPKGKLSNVDLPAILRKEEAWALLPQEKRQQLYAMLPPPRAGEAPFDVDVHPLNTPLKPYIEAELRRWQNDLVDGREVKSWREQAMQAGKERAEGKWDEWKQQQREQDWGKPDENVKPNKFENVEATQAEEAVGRASDAKGDVPMLEYYREV